MSKYVPKTYRLADDRSGLSFMLKTGKNGDLLVFDEDKGYNRAIRYCPNEKSIFIEEQSQHALVVPIIFESGYLEVDAKDQTLQKFLDAHPDNLANKGVWFEQVDEEKEAKESIELDEKIIDIKQAIRNKLKEDDGIFQVEAAVAVVLDSVDEASRMGKEEMKRVLYQEVDINPHYFMDEEGNVTIFNDDTVTRKYFVLRAIKDGIIKKSANERSMLWTKDNTVIASAPIGLKLVEYFADFLGTDDGLLVAEEIKRRS